MGIDSFILSSINIFPELVVDLLTLCKNGDMSRAKDLQEKLSSCVIAIMKYGKYIYIIFISKGIVNYNRLFVDNRIQATKIAMDLLTDIDVGLSRASPNSISSEIISITMIKDLTNLGYQPKIKNY